MIGIIFLVDLVDKDQKPVAADDASSAAWYDVRDMLKKPELFAFDHFSIFEEVINKCDKYQTLRPNYKPEEAALSETGGGTCPLAFVFNTNIALFVAGMAVGAFIMNAKHNKS